MTLGLAAGVAVARQPSVPAGAAFFLKSLQSPTERREARSDILDTPVLPGSLIKTVTLVAALESQVIEPGASRVCRRVTTIEGRRYVCSHPDLKRPLSASEALAYSCNDFFVSLAPRLPRGVVNEVRRQVGLPPIAADANYAAALVGLDGPRASPRVLLAVVTLLAGLDRDRPVTMKEQTRRVLLEGLRGAARFGTASALDDRKITALAKTGTAPMPGGAFMGMVVALTPADTPTRAIVVVAPGAAGLDAAEIAADVFTGSGSQGIAAPGAGRPAAVAEASADRKGRPLQVRIGRTSGQRITTLDLEDYIARVVSGEGEPRAADAAQQTLAITARTFAIANLNRHQREGYDFCDTTHCQVFRDATEASRRAVQATMGRVLLHQGQPATVFYSALCGGRSELASNVWPGAVDYDSEPRDDEACEDEPPWESEVRVDQVERALRDAGLRGSRLRSLRVVSRNGSGRVARLQADGFTPSEIAGHDFRMALGRVAGWQRIKSTNFEVRRTGNGFQLRGRGMGHGVGLCVIGAGKRASAGRSADEILRFYFPTLQVGVIPETATASRGTVPPPPPRPAADTKADVRIALPANEESERPRIVELVRRARDQIAATASVAAPAAITVTVHTSVEAFGRATGQPWWMSAATEGTAIALLPLTILRQRGQIERTIRHEVAHVLIDPVLKGRPLWVREGVALYFTDPEAPAGDTTRGSCPKDDEFLRPVSAGTHRAAYARAESCVRHAIAGGKSWRDLK